MKTQRSHGTIQQFEHLLRDRIAQLNEKDEIHSSTTSRKYPKNYIKSATDNAEDFEIDKTNGVLVKYHGNAANVVVPNSVTSIDNGAFQDCISLKSITIPDSVTSIGDYAFSGCRSLKSVTIPDGVTKIGDHAFQDCTGLTNITIPDGVTEIGYGAFDGCSILTSITIPDSVTEMRIGAFDGCKSLTSITIPDGVTKIGDYAFRGCTSLTNIMIPDSVTEIGWSAFQDCRSLTNITIPDSVTEIGGYAFSGCTSLTKISLSDNIELGNNVFKSTPLESKFNQDEDEVVEPEDEFDDEFDDEYDEFDQEAGVEFIEKLEDLIRQNYDVIDYFEEPSIQGGVGSDVITMTLNDGKSYEFWFDFEDEVDTIMTDGPESAARQYFAKIQDGIDSGEALVED